MYESTSSDARAMASPDGYDSLDCNSTANKLNFCDGTPMDWSGHLSIQRPDNPLLQVIAAARFASWASTLSAD